MSCRDTAHREMPCRPDASRSECRACWACRYGAVDDLPALVERGLLGQVVGGRMKFVDTASRSTTPMTFCHGPVPMRSRALTRSAGSHRSAPACSGRHATRGRAAPAALARAWQCWSAPQVRRDRRPCPDRRWSRRTSCPSGSAAAACSRNSPEPSRPRPVPVVRINVCIVVSCRLDERNSRPVRQLARRAVGRTSAIILPATREFVNEPAAPAISPTTSEKSPAAVISPMRTGLSLRIAFKTWA